MKRSTRRCEMAFVEQVSIVEGEGASLRTSLERTPLGELPDRIGEFLNTWDRSARGLSVAWIEDEVRAAKRWLGNEDDYQGLIWPLLEQNYSL